MITFSLDKKDFRLAKDVLQFVREKVDNQENYIFDVLIASVWLMFHSEDKSRKRWNLMDQILIDQQVQTLAYGKHDIKAGERLVNTEPNIVKQSNGKLADENKLNHVDNTTKQTNKNKSLFYKDTGSNRDQNSREKVGFLSCMQEKIQKSYKHKQENIHNNSRNRSKIGADEQVSVAKEQDKNRINIEGERESLDTCNDNVVKVEKDIVTIHMNDDYSEETDKNKETHRIYNVSTESDDISLNMHVVEDNDTDKANVERGDLFHDNDYEPHEENVTDINKYTGYAEHNGALYSLDLDTTDITRKSGKILDVKSEEELDQSLLDEIKIDIDDIDDNDTTDVEESLQDLSALGNEVITVKPMAQAQPVMIMSNIFNSEAQCSDWPSGDLMVNTAPDIQKLLESVYKDSSFDTNDTIRTLGDCSAHKTGRSNVEKCKDMIKSLSEGQFRVGKTQVKNISKHKTVITEDYPARDVSSMERRKRIELSLKQKVEVINHSYGKSSRQLAKIFGIGKTQVQTILKRKAEIIEAYQENTGEDRKRIKLSTQNEELDKVVLEWFKTTSSNGVKVSGAMVQRKALAYAQELSVSGDFKASSGWLKGFRQRHNVSFVTTFSGENDSVSQESVSQENTSDSSPKMNDMVRTLKEEKDLMKQ